MPEAMGRVKACHECRQQKVRCDAYKNYAEPCSRCRAAGVPCIVSAKFQRSKRQTKAQLQYEVDQLRSQLKGRSRSLDDTLATHPWSHDDSPHDQSSSLAAQLREDPGEGSQSPSVSGTSGEPYRLSSVGSESTGQESATSNNRTIGDFQVEGHKIEDCYKLFKKHYAPYLEGLFSDTPLPNEVYSQSALLFWAIVYVGARRYKRDVTIHSRLGPLIIDFAFTSLISPSRPLPVILAAIIICNWPPPIDMVYKDPCPALAGAALNLAIQNGLHMHRREQDFVNKTRKRSSYTASSPSADVLPFALGVGDPATIYRIRVWAWCKISFQSSCLCEGLPPPNVPAFKSDDHCKMLRSVLPSGLSYRVRIHKIQTEAAHLVADGLDPESTKADNVLTTTLDALDNRIRENYHETGNDYQYLVQTCARLWTLAMYFVTTVNDDGIHMLHLYRVARDLITYVSNQDQNTSNYAAFLPHYFSRSIFVAAHCVLRICKSHLIHKLDIQEAEQTFFASVDLLKRTSVQANDLDARNSIILPQLWSSNRVFIKGSGPQNGLHMDLRDRLGASAAFDNFWWWRAHFGNLKTTEETTQHLQESQKELQETIQQGQLLNRPADEQMQIAVRLLENQPQQAADSVPVTEDSLHGLMDWDPMVMENDLLWGYWPNSGFDYSGIENVVEVSTDSIPPHHQLL